MLNLIVRSILLGMVLCSATAPAMGQALDFAFFGGIGGGAAAYDNGAFSRRLKSYTPARQSGESFLYQTEDFPVTGWTADAALGFLFGGEFVVGASGQKVFYPVIRSINGPNNARDEYQLSGGGGGIDIGYALVNDKGTLVFPYIQGGYYGHSLEYSNNQDEPIPFFEGKPVPAGESATYTGWAPRIALGIGIVRALGGASESSSGGLTLAARLSWGVMPSRPEWQEPDGSVVNNGGLTPAYNGVSLSVTVGGGLWGGR